MPMYDYLCTYCSKDYNDIFMHLDEKDRAMCPSCGAFMVSQITIRSAPQFYEGYDEQLDAYLTGPKQKQRILKEKGLVEISKSDSGKLSQLVTKTKKKTVGEFIKEKGIEIPKYNIRT